MLRYLLIATVIVFVVGAIATAVHRRWAQLRVASVQSTGSPSPPRRQSPSTLSPGSVTGDAPWAFDALIDCFHHERTFRGTLSWVKRHVPSTAQTLQSDWLLRSGPCTASKDDDGVRVMRGSSPAPGVDVRIPPHVTVLIDGHLTEPELPRTREVYVLRWKSPSEARLDRLSTMSDARLQRTRG